jgi:hypothetical protein
MGVVAKLRLEGTPFFVAPEISLWWGTRRSLAQL